jgi:hypothetical protein
MWYLLIISIVNAACDQKGVILVHRVEIFGLPINILDGLTFLGLLGVFLGGIFKRSASPYPRHPLYPTLLVLFALGTAAGTIGWQTNGAEVYGFSMELRNFTTFAIAIMMGHYYLKTPRSDVRFAYVHVLSGVLSAALILLFFVGAGATETAVKIETIRATQYVSVYAGVATAFLLFTLLVPKCRILPVPVAIVVMAFCLVGQFATLNRSDWVACMLAVVSVLFLLPKEGRGPKLVGFALAVPALVVSLIVGVVVVSKLTDRQNLAERMQQRVVTLLPGERGDDSITSTKAWDTRLPGLLRELEFWKQSPLIGQGFGYTTNWLRSEDVAFNHNVWTASLATTGVFGFSAYLVSVLCLIVVGRRMVRQNIDRGSVLIGAIAFTAGVYNLFFGGMTMSFNIQRQALPLGLVVGIMLKAREMQLATMQEYAGYIDFEAMQDGAGFADPAEAAFSPGGSERFA